VQQGKRAGVAAALGMVAGVVVVMVALLLLLLLLLPGPVGVRVLQGLLALLVWRVLLVLLVQWCSFSRCRGLLPLLLQTRLLAPSLFQLSVQAGW